MKVLDNRIIFLDILIIIFLINNVVYFISQYLGLLRPIINVDYILCYLLFCLIPKKYRKIGIFAALSIIICMVDVLILALQVFPFVKMNDIFYLSTFIFIGPQAYQKYLMIFILYLTILFYILTNFITANNNFNKKIILTIIFLVTLIALLDISLIRSQTLFFLENYRSNYNSINKNATLLLDNKYNFISAPLFNENKKNSKKIIFIINESWGVSKNKKIQAEVISPIYDHKENYNYIENGGFKFIGATVNGELRELCQKNATVLNIEKIKGKEFINCLPRRMNEKGYATYSVHGAESGIYDRKRWYPLAGFNQILFKENFDNARNCKAFSGKCDYDLFEPVVDILANNDKVFLYWLTLNTHSPYDDKLFVNGFDCTQYDIETDSETCLNLKQQYQFFYRLSEYVQDDRMKGVEVYVVGDHAPPIMSFKDNFNTFEDLEVGWVKFKIKDK